MPELIPFPSAVYDTTIIVKGLVPPRRKKKDELYEEQVKLHTIAGNLLKNVEEGITELGILPWLLLKPLQ